MYNCYDKFKIRNPILSAENKERDVPSHLFKALTLASPFSIL